MSSHSHLTAELSRSRLDGITVDSLCLESDVARLIEIERSIVGLSAESRPASFEAFCQVLDSSRSGWPAGQRDDGATPFAQANPSDIASWALVTDVLGVPSLACDQDPSLVRLMVALTPVVRSHYLFRRQRPSWALLAPPELMAIRYTLGVQKIVALALDAGMRTVTYQTVMAVVRRYGPLLDLLSLCDSTAGLRPQMCAAEKGLGVPLAWHERLRQAESSLSRADPGRKLGDVLKEALDGLSLGRLGALNYMARSLLPNLVQGTRSGPSKAARLFRRAPLFPTPIGMIRHLLGNRRSSP